MVQFKDKADFDVRWLPFQLNPAAEGGPGVNKLQMYEEKFGPDRVKQMMPRLIDAGKGDGINFSFGGNTGNTFDSHRLISFAAKQGKQDAMIEELFKNYFEEEKCLSDLEVLTAAAQKCGVEGAEEMLRTGAETEEVKSDLMKYQRGMRISGVPHFIINGQYQESGAQDPSTFASIFSKVLK
mmetsp:Transcript_20609/g.45112  ORF Transcript_20609/g.45112 Transcript_20609/m.45112 type:complete len:182 (-) Transcript_20609:274-819(-)|eukprot:CAMPEP_0170604062 /NCGR_PEP_ID=MMETSP0224-20130122/19229_1 /TAXON_ID=285029 /ORGANISM="Togula jolla, Strain CCCM 725" /LENGTH=181 /DNA_ID=CAMNT_0010928953 /DNA_START=128 /DNA_END=673 /DNA_ORIENTATION=+